MKKFLCYFALILAGLFQSCTEEITNSATFELDPEEIRLIVREEVAAGVQPVIQAVREEGSLTRETVKKGFAEMSLQLDQLEDNILLEVQNQGKMTRAQADSIAAYQQAQFELIQARFNHQDELHEEEREMLEDLAERLNGLEDLLIQYGDDIEDILDEIDELKEDYTDMAQDLFELRLITETGFTGIDNRLDILADAVGGVYQLVELVLATGQQNQAFLIELLDYAEDDAAANALILSKLDLIYGEVTAFRAEYQADFAETTANFAQVFTRLDQQDSTATARHNTYMSNFVQLFGGQQLILQGQANGQALAIEHYNNTVAMFEAQNVVLAQLVAGQAQILTSIHNFQAQYTQDNAAIQNTLASLVTLNQQNHAELMAAIGGIANYENILSEILANICDVLVNQQDILNAIQQLGNCCSGNNGPDIHVIVNNNLQQIVNNNIVFEICCGNGWMPNPMPPSMPNCGD